MLGVGDGVTDHVLKEGLEDATSLLVDEAGDSLDSATAGQTADGWLGDALDVVTKDLPVTLGASLSEALASFATSRHDATVPTRTKCSQKNESDAFGSPTLFAKARLFSPDRSGSWVMRMRIDLFQNDPSSIRKL